MTESSENPYRPLPTALAVAEALNHYRTLDGMPPSDLAYIASLRGYEITPQRLERIERAEEPATVDDLVALSHAPQISPLRLLGHVHSDAYSTESSPATALPHDVTQAELIAWLRDETGMDSESRAAWHREHADAHLIRATFLDDQLPGAKDELGEMGELALREAKAPQVIELHDRIEHLEELWANEQDLDWEDEQPDRE